MGRWESLVARRSVVVPVVVGVVAGLLGLVYLVGFLRGEEGVAEPPEVQTEGFVNRQGGYRLQVPTHLKVTREGRTTRFTAPDRSVVVVIGPAAHGSLAMASRAFESSVRDTYRGVRITGRERQRVNGRPAMMTAGRAVNSGGVDLRFIGVVVRGRSHNVVMASYTAAESNPAEVLPSLNAMVNSLEPLPRRRSR